jgi:hypothetical protein
MGSPRPMLASSPLDQLQRLQERNQVLLLLIA